MLRLVRTEMVKQVRRPRTWVALGFVTIVPIIIATHVVMLWRLAAPAPARRSRS